VTTDFLSNIENPHRLVPMFLIGIFTDEDSSLELVACAERVPSVGTSRSTGAPSENDGVNRTDESFPGRIKSNAPKEGALLSSSGGRNIFWSN
jgi:hypothetical protein